MVQKLVFEGAIKVVGYEIKACKRRLTNPSHGTRPLHILDTVRYLRSGCWEGLLLADSVEKVGHGCHGRRVRA